MQGERGLDICALSCCRILKWCRKFNAGALAGGGQRESGYSQRLYFFQAALSYLISLDQGICFIPNSTAWEHSKLHSEYLHMFGVELSIPPGNVGFRRSFVLFLVDSEMQCI